MTKLFSEVGNFAFLTVVILTVQVVPVMFLIWVDHFWHNRKK